MDPYKKNRLKAAIQRGLSELIATQVKDPRVGMVSVSQVELNRDNSQAKIYVAVTGDEDEQKLCLAGLKTAAGFLQGQLGRMLRLRTVPVLQFAYDDSMDRGFGIEEVLRELEEQGEFADEAERRRQLSLEDFEPPSELIDPLREAETIWISGHWSPDPDCVGAALALAAALEALEKDVTVFRFPEPPAGLTTLPGWDATVDASEAPAMLEEAAPDLVLLVDCHRSDRCGPLQDTFDRIESVVCVDHHLVSGRRAPVPGWLDARAESTCTLAYRVIQVLAGDDDEVLDVDVATNLFAGLAGDTGGFRFDNVGPATFRLAAELADRGVNTAELQHRLLHQRRRQGLDLMQRALASVTYAGGGRVALMRISLDDLAATSASVAETEGLVNILMSVEGVRYAALLKEIETDVWRGSLRCHDGDVQAVASAFGGGGHVRAAGCTVEGSGDDVAARMTEALLTAE